MSQAAATVDVRPMGVLIPITPEDSSRYGRQHIVHLSPAEIDARLPGPKYPASHWFAYAHPEGQLYHVFVAPGRLRVVTDEDVDDATTLDGLTIWVSHIEDVLRANMVELHIDIELMIELRGEDCAYYLVDYRARSIFWAQTMFTYEVGLPDVSSPTNLAITTEAQFWRHIEYYPSHCGGVTRQDIDALHCVFSHALTDQLTSTTSTFPYKVQDCNQFLSVLDGLKDHPTDANTASVVARLWCLVYLHRASVHYGTPHARLNRNQRIFEHNEDAHWVARCASVGSCHIYNDYRARLDDLYTDDMVYGDHWRKFIEYALNDWRTVSSHAACLLLAHTAFLFMASSAPLAVTSATVNAFSGLSALLMTHRHSSLLSTSTTAAARYLNAICHERYRFQIAALSMALPRTLHIWGIVTLMVNLLCVVASAFGLLPVLLILVAAAGCYLLMVSGTATIDVAPEDMILPYSTPIYSDLKV